jgi:DNA adenine methylase
LVRTYRAIRDGVEHVIALLKSYEHAREKFDELRACDVGKLDDVHVAAWFVYLNKTCFNGLYRVNADNVFNVPFDDTRQRQTRICDDETLRACSDALRGVQIRHAHFAETLTEVESGDLIYFDPPYVPLSASSSFTAYTSDGFDLAEQVKLRDVARDLKRRGAHVLLSNSSAPLVSKLYSKDFTIEHVNAGRSINYDGAKRGRVAESIIR